MKIRRITPVEEIGLLCKEIQSSITEGRLNPFWACQALRLILAPNQAASNWDPAWVKRLTIDDLVYLDLRMHGKSDQQIADDLGVKKESIYTKRTRIAEKLGLKTALDLDTFLLRLLSGNRT